MTTTGLHASSAGSGQAPPPSRAQRSPAAGRRIGKSSPPPSAHAQLLRGIEKELRRLDPAGSGLSKVTDLDGLARQVAGTLLHSLPTWVEHLGPFYDAAGVAQLLGRDGRPISRQAVSKRKGLLALTTGSGQVVYPALQFKDRRPAPGLAEVLDALPESVVSRWTLASWLCSPELDLQGERPIDVLHEGTPGALNAVVDAARRWRQSLAA